LEEHSASIFKVEESAMQGLSKKRVAGKPLLLCQEINALYVSRAVLAAWLLLA
jgi:hypothetical protein